MISVTEARTIVQAHQRSFGEEEISFEFAGGRVLAEEIVADRDFPAFHRASMDGIVIHSADWNEGMRTFLIIGEQLAGAKQLELQEPGACREIMTGAVVSDGGDMVIRYEDVAIVGKEATVADIEINQWANIHKQGTDAKKDDVLIQSGKRLNAGDIGILASVGKVMVRVRKQPVVAIISTGDELVSVNEQPLPYQIRRSNSSVLMEMTRKEGLICEDFHLKDDEEEIRTELPKIIERFDVVLISGGVSKGKRDYVPEMLEELGVKKHFHRVAQRPGQPLWFGSNEQVVVFGFPGNPVSTMVCFQVYFREWLTASMRYENPIVKARLTASITFKPSLTYFVPVKLSFEGNELTATPIPGHGSGDLVNLSNADGFIELSSEREVFEMGEVHSVKRL